MSALRSTPSDVSSARPGRRWPVHLLEDRCNQVLIGLIVIGAVLRFSTLGLQSFDYEEVVVARIVHGDLLQTVTSAFHERTPPTYYVLAWSWTRAFGVHEVGLRSLSALLGTLTIPAAYAVGTALARRSAGLLAAALVAVNPMLVWYSQYARAYVLLVLFATVGLYFFARALREPAGRALDWWAVTSILALLSHYFAGFLVVPEAAWLLWMPRSRRAVAPRVAAIAAFGIAMIPLIFFQAATHDLAEDYAGRPIAGRLFRTLGSFAAGPQVQLGSSTLVGRLGILAAVSSAVVLLYAAFVLARRARFSEFHRTLVVGGVGLIALILPVLLATVEIDYLLPRYSIAVVVPLIMVVAVGLAGGSSRAMGFAAAAALSLIFAGVVVASNLSTSTRLPASRDVAAAIGPAQGPRALVVPKSVSKTLVYYLRHGRAQLIRRGGHGSKVTLEPNKVLRVSEIVAVADSSRLMAPSPGFRLVSHRRVDRFWVSSYRSRTVRPITIRKLDEWRGGHGAVLTDRARAQFT